MFLMSLFRRPKQVVNLLDVCAFRRAVDEERMRVDRNGRTFSLVVFDCGERGGEAMSRQISTACRDRLRMIDQVGSLASGEVGLLLPGTDVLGTQKVVNDIAGLVSGDGDSLPYKIFVCPETSFLESQDEICEASTTPVLPVADLLVEPLPAWKRALDIAGAMFGLTLAMPVMIAAAIAIKLDSRGPVNDRRWMVTDTDGMAITQREISALALVQPTFKADCLALNAPEMPEMLIPLHYTLGHIRQAEVWGDVCKAWDEGEAVAEWLLREVTT